MNILIQFFLYKHDLIHTPHTWPNLCIIEKAHVNLLLSKWLYYFTSSWCLHQYCILCSIHNKVKEHLNDNTQNLIKIQQNISSNSSSDRNVFMEMRSHWSGSLWNNDEGNFLMTHSGHPVQAIPSLRVVVTLVLCPRHFTCQTLVLVQSRNSAFTVLRPWDLVELLFL